MKYGLKQHIMKNPAAVALGWLGGKKKSHRKSEAARNNGKKGGRPTKMKTTIATLQLLKQREITVRKEGIPVEICQK